MTNQTVLAGVDFSPITTAVLRRARSLAGEGGTIRLVHVVDTTLVPNAALIDSNLIDECNAAMARDAADQLAVLARTLELAGLQVETRVLRGRPADGLLSVTDGVSYVVVGAHARGTVGRLFLGSVAEELARRSPAPVLVVRERAEGISAERILLAIDASEPFPEATLVASDLARLTGARVEAIAVIPLPEAKGSAETVAKLRQLRSQVVRMARFSVRELVSKAVGESIAVRVSIGTPATKILEYARPTDILVCATHGRGALGRLAFGSVATKLSRRAPCPVLFVRGPRAAAESRVAHVAVANVS